MKSTILPQKHKRRKRRLSVVISTVLILSIGLVKEFKALKLLSKYNSFIRLESEIIVLSNETVETATLSFNNIANPWTDSSARSSWLHPSHIDTVYHIGWSGPFGDTNNMILVIVKCIDMAIDQGHAVVAVSTWALDVLHNLILDEPNPKEWAIKLENVKDALLPLVDFNRLEALNLTETNNVTIIGLDARDVFYSQVEASKMDEVKPRRRLILSSLFHQHVSKQNFDGYHALQKHLLKSSNNQNITTGQWHHTNYTVIHSRWLQGECEERVHKAMGPDFPTDECFMYPTYIKSLLGEQITQPIVLITDGQHNETEYRLQHDPDIGPWLIKQKDLMVQQGTIQHHNLYYVFNDMLVGIMSHTFIGTRVSTFALNIAATRYGMGLDPNTTYVGSSAYKFLGI